MYPSTLSTCGMEMERVLRMESTSDDEVVQVEYNRDLQRVTIRVTTVRGEHLYKEIELKER